MVKRSFIPAILLLQLFSYFLYIKLEDYNFLLVYFSFSCVSLIFIERMQNIYSLLLFFLVFIFFTIFSFFSKNNQFALNLYNTSLGLSAFLSANLLFKVENSYKYIRILFLLYTVMLFYYFMKFGISDPDLYNEILEKGSRNYVSGIYIFLLCLLILTYDKQGLRIPFIYPLLTFLGCVILYGRSGIMISFLILIYLYFFNRRYLSLKIIFSFCILFILLLNFDLIINFFSEKTSFSYGIKSDRSVMLEEYFSGIAKQNFSILFGANIQECCQLIESFENNPHNSFISGHMRFGIVHTIFTVSILFYVLTSKRLLYIFILLILYSRLFLDQLGLFSPLDIVIFYLLFLVYDSKKLRKSINE